MEDVVDSKPPRDDFDDSDEGADKLDVECDEDEPLFSCPFCGREDDGCPHFLGSRDMNFCDGFSVDSAGELDDLSEQFEVLEEAVDSFLQAGKRKQRIAVITPRRLRNLVQAVADGSTESGFTQYVKQLGLDSKVAVKSASYSESGGPGMSSEVMMFWASDVSVAVAGMTKLIELDVRRLQRPA